jgi:uncharacterized membrane protein YheB (UPF0754 family)
MDTPTLLLGAATVLVGALSGGLTNAIAIWMLFHPYERRGWGPFKLEGAIPKNKPRLAKSIGRTVGEKLLTPEDVTRRMNNPAVKEAFTAAIDRIITDILEAERGPLKDQLAPEVAKSVEDALASLGSRAADALASYTSREEFAAQVEDAVRKLRDDVGERPISEVLTVARREALHRKVEEWVSQLADGEEMAKTLRQFVHNQMDRLAADDTALIDRLPPGIIGAVEQGITDYLPVALERIGSVLSDPEAKGRIQAALRQAFDRSVRDMLLHERLIAKIVVTDATFKRLLDGIEADGFERFAAAMTSPDMRARLSKAVNDAVVNFLRIPLGERLRRMGDDKRAALEETLVDWLIRVTRDEGTRAVIGKTIDRALDAAEQRTWGEVLDVVPPERAAKVIGDALAGEQGRRWVAEAADGLVRNLMARPLGQPSQWLGEDTSTALKNGVATAAWNWTQAQVPGIVDQFNVQEMVENKVLGFSTQRMEEIVKRVTDRELKLIVRLGYLLGGLVGFLAFLINLLAR